MNDKVKEKKQALIAKMKKTQSERGSAKLQVQTPIPEHYPQKDWKMLYKKKEKEAEACRREKIGLSKELRELRRQVNILKADKHKNQLALEASISANKGLTIEMERLSKLLTEKERLIDGLNEQSLLAEMKGLEKEISRLREINSKLKIQQTSYKGEIIALNEKLATMSLLNQKEQQEQIDRLNQVNLSLSRELNAYKTKLEKIKLELQELQLMHNVEQLIAVLNLKLRYETLEEFHRLDELIRRVRFMRRAVEKHKHKNIRKALSQRQTKECIQYGYLFEREGWFWFTCISSDEIYRVGGNPMVLKSDMPASAVIRHGWANVVSIYEEYEAPNFETKELKKHSYGIDAATEQGDHIFNLKGLRVLIIGSRNLAKYQAALERCGVIVEVNNPYEENIEVRRGAFDRADVVVICTSHVPHNMLSQIELSDQKVEMMERDNVKSIVARVRFAALRLSIKIANGENSLGTTLR